MLHAQVVVAAQDRPLEQAPDALDDVRVNVAPDTTTAAITHELLRTRKGEPCPATSGAVRLSGDEKEYPSAHRKADQGQSPRTQFDFSIVTS